MNLVKTGLILMITGFILVFVATLLPFISMVISGIESEGRVEVTGGGCILLFFIPICFGYGSPVILTVLVVLAIILVIVSYLFFRAMTRNVDVYSFKSI